MASICLNIKELERRRKQRNWTKRKMIEKIGVSSPTFYRICLPINDSRHDNPGEKFIRGVLNAFPDAKFEDLFFLN